MHAWEYVRRMRRKKSIIESKKRIRKNMAKRENEKNIYRNGGLDCCHPVRVSASAI